MQSVTSAPAYLLNAYEHAWSKHVMKQLEVLTEHPMSLALLPSSFQRNNLLCSLICFLNKFGKAGA
jgi:hypothetical protein